MTGNRYFLEDAKTPGGTFVNDEPVRGRVPLQVGRPDSRRQAACCASDEAQEAVKLSRLSVSVDPTDKLITTSDY